MEQSLSSSSLSGNASAGNTGNSRSQPSNQQQGTSATNSGTGVNINNSSNDNTELHDSSLEEIRGLSCQICYQNFSRDGEHVPRNLQCGHSYCTSCLNRLVGQFCIGTVRCPTCKHETLINGFMDDVHQLPKNFGVLEILAAQEDDTQRQGRRNPAMPKRPPPKPPNPPVTGAASPAPGASVGSSRLAHVGSNSLGSSGGSIGIAAPPSNYDISPYEMRCEVHEGEPMKVFCKSCNELICIYCQVYGSHQQHTCELVSQTAEQGRREVISMSENLGRSKENLLLARQIIIETISAVRHKEEKTIREVTHHFDTMRKRVHKRECQLKDMVKCKTSQKIAALEAQERTISDLIDRCEVTQRVCTRSLTEDDVTVVQEKDALLHEMTALSDISTECELAPVCIDNILCMLPRDAFDVIMIHGTVEESTTSDQDQLGNLADMASSSRQADVGFGDRLWAETVEDSLSFLPNPPRDDPELGSNAFRQTRRGASQWARGRLANPLGAHELFAIGGGLIPQFPSDVPTVNLARFNHARHRSLSHHSGRQRADLNASYSSQEDQLRSSIEEAIRAVQNAEMRESRGSRGVVLQPQCPREAAAQAAIKRQQVTQNLVGNILSVVRPSLEQQMSQEGQQSVDDAQLTSNLTTIESAMQEIQSAVSSARATLEESMGNNPINTSPGQGNDSNGSSTASSTTQQASPDSGSFEVARPSVQSGDEEEADDDRIYEQVSDGEVDNEQPPSSQVSIGQIVPEMLPQHPISDLVPVSSNGHIQGDQSPLYHVYDSSNSAVYHTVNPSPVNQQATRLNYNSDSSDDRLPMTRNGEDIYDGPYYSCDCGEDSVSCSCSECNSADDDDDDAPNMMINGRGQGATAGRSSGCRQRQFFSGIPNHLDLSSSLESQAALQQMLHPAIMRQYRIQNDHQGDVVPGQLAGSSRDQNSGEDMGTMSKLLNRMNLIKNKNKNAGARKKHHHKSSTPTHRPRNARPRVHHDNHNNILTSSSGSCGPFFLSPNRNCSEQGTSSNVAGASSSQASIPSGGTRPKTSNAQKQKSAKKTKTAPRPNELRSHRQQGVVARGVSAESLATSALTRGMVMNSESHHNLSHSSLANSLPKCVNATNGSCLSDERALFACSFCRKKYCHICAVHAAGKKCSKKPNKTHSIVGLDEDFNEGNNNPNPNLNVPKNPDSVSHTFMLKCTNCGDVSEFKVNSKTCNKCRAELQVDLNLYNPCPNCDLLNSKDAIACELCSSDIIPIN